jgi:hypothetical protein
LVIMRIRRTTQSAADSHPSTSDLLLADSGEVSGDHLIQVRDHLWHCAACQQTTRDAQDTISYTSGRQAAEDAHPAPRWVGFRQRLVDTARVSQASRARLPNRAWVKWAAIVPLIWAVTIPGRLVPTLRANELIEGAVSAEQRPDGRPVTVRIAVTDPHERGSQSLTINGSRRTPGVTRVMTRRVAIAGAPAHLAQADGEEQEPNSQDFSAFFLRAGLDWNDPLSAAAFRGWRQHLTSKRDSVLERPDAIAVETSSDDGFIRHGILLLERRTLRPRQMEWTLWNEVRIQIERIDAPTPSPEHLPEPSRPAATTVASAIVAPAVDPDHVELEVRAALHRVEADVRDDLRIARTPDNRVIVEGVVDRRERASALRSHLRQVPGTVVRVRSADELPVTLSRSSTPSTVVIVNQQAAQPAQLAAWLTRTFPTAAAQQEYAGTALREAREIKAQVLAIRRLSSRYPDQERMRLSTADRATLDGLFQSYAAALQTLLDTLDRHLAPVWEISPTSRPSPSSPERAVDVDGALVDSLTKHGSDLERLVLELFADVDGSTTPTEGDLTTTVEATAGHLQACRRVLAEWKRQIQ